VLAVRDHSDETANYTIKERAHKFSQFVKSSICKTKHQIFVSSVKLISLSLSLSLSVLLLISMGIETHDSTLLLFAAEC
jgi:hypothetical protein